MGCLDGGPFLCTPATGNRSACLFNPELTDMDELYRLARHLGNAHKYFRTDKMDPCFVNSQAGVDGQTHQ